MNMLPDIDASAYLLDRKHSRAKAEPKTVLAEILPARLAAAIAGMHLPVRPIGDLPDRLLTDLGGHLHRWRLTPSGSEGYAKAEVTLGGVDTAGLSSRTMAAEAVPGLHVIGEGG